jgi:molybdopterin-guanine dinucleotide biosynthesis protein MobB
VQDQQHRAVIGFVGSSGVGKTTLLERVIPQLETRGLAVGAVKHASHGFEADRPGKDSHRLHGAGAQAVALVSRDRLACFERLPEDAAEASLARALAALPLRLDVVLVEGFAWEPIPRVVLVGGREAPRHELLSGGEVIRILRTRPTPEGDGVIFPPGTVDAVVRDVMARVRRHVACRCAANDERVKVLGTG